MFDISNSERYFGFVVDEFSELVHTRKSPLLFVARLTSQNLDRISHSHVLGVFEVDMVIKVR